MLFGQFQETAATVARKQILPITATPESVGMVSPRAREKLVAVLCTSHAAAFAARL